MTTDKQQETQPPFRWYYKLQRQGGSSLTTTIPQPLIHLLKLSNGDYVEIRLEGDQIIIRKV